MLFSTFIQLALLAPFALSESLEPYRHIKRSALESRQNCLPGSTTCSVSGIIRYCANPGYKCCDSDNVAPLTATCCPGGSYAPLGSYCCSNGRYCTNGRTCTGCTPVSGTGGFVNSQSIVVPSVTRPPAVPTSTRVVPVNTYFTFTITYYYFQYYYIYVQALSRSSPTSSTVTTTTTVSVFAANSAEARSSFNDISATLPLPTPASATYLPPLPEQTSAFVLPTPTSTRAGGGGAAATSSTAGPEQFVGGTGKARENGWWGVLAGGVVGVVGLVV